MSLQQKLESMKKKVKDVKPDSDGHEECGYNMALSDVIAILDKEEKCYCNQWGMPKIRPELKEFMIAMESELARHDAERGDSWKSMDVNELEDLFGEHVENWWNNYEGHYSESNTPDDYVDIANLAMMLWYKITEPALADGK